MIRVNMGLTSLRCMEILGISVRTVITLWQSGIPPGLIADLSRAKMGWESWDLRKLGSGLGVVGHGGVAAGVLVAGGEEEGSG